MLGFVFSHKTYKVLTFLWALFILILCIIPGRDLPHSNLFQIDKVFHFTFYAILMYGMIKSRISRTKNYLLFSCLAAILYGVAIECIQGALLQDRFFDIYDIVANSTGACIVLGLYVYKLHTTSK